LVYLKKKKIASTRTAMPADPNADKIPIRMPLPVEPALILITTDDNPELPGWNPDCWSKPWLSAGIEVGARDVDDKGNEEVESVEGRGEGLKEWRMALGSIAACFCIAHSIISNQRRKEGCPHSECRMTR
jgi:hypothetical protein